MALQEYTKKSMKNLPIEAKVIRKLIRTLKDAGTPIVSVRDEDSRIKVDGEHDILNLVFQFDMVIVHTQGGGWVLLVFGNAWDVVSDYSVNLGPTLKPLYEWTEKNESA